jgi:nicotinamide riboside kinase
VKIAFIGTHGVGKTTLCYDLAAALKRQGVHVDMVKEVARLSPLPINRQTSIEAQTWILMTQVAEEIRSAAYHAVVVCDRSVLDNYAYMLLACGRQPPYERFVAYWMKTYDLLFKVPISGAPSADGVRDTDEFFMRSIDQLVDRLLGEMKVPYESLAPDRREGWIERVRDIVLKRPELARLF